MTYRIVIAKYGKKGLKKSLIKAFNVPFLLTLILSFITVNFTFAEDRLVILSPHWEGIKTEFGRAFTEWYRKNTGRNVSVDWRDMGGANDDLRFVLSEFQQTPNTIGIDLFFGGGIDPFLTLKEKNLLQSYHPQDSILAKVPKELSGLPLYDPEYEWFGTALSSFGILKNDKIIRELNLPVVSSWKDLANPKLKDWIGCADPRNSGSSHMVFESILQAYGWEEGWRVILGMASNVREFDRSTGAAAKSCTMGNVAYSLIVDFYGFIQISEAGSDNMSLLIPASESILNPDSIAILKGAPHQAVAERFIDFVLSEEAQNLWLAPKGHTAGPKQFSIERMAIRPDLYEKFAGVTLMKTNPFRDLTPLSYNSKLGTLRWSVLNSLIGAFVIDSPRPSRRSLRIPVSEEETNALAKGDWRNPLRRTEIQLTWQRQSQR
jgi:ABC-type Fe3+ transport system substrate-binding protein